MPPSPHKVMRALSAVADERRESAADLWLNTQVPKILRGICQKYADDIDGFMSGNGLDGAKVAKVKDYLAEPTQFLILHGPKGTGKTALSSWIGYQLVEDASARLFSLPDMINKLSTLPFEQRHALQTLVNEADLLVLDDIGAADSTLTAFQHKAIWSLIDERYKNPDLITILTTNLAVFHEEEESLVKWCGDSAWDRISSSLTRVHMTGESLR